MKKLVTDYTFDASAKTIISPDFVSLESIALITNVTDNLIIYNFADPTAGGTLAGTTLTLDYDTTAMADADDLMILVEVDTINENGRLKVSAVPAEQVGVTDNITAIADTVVLDVANTSNIVAHCYGTFSTVNVTFEASINSTNGTDGNWFTIQLVRTSANTIETTSGNLSAAPAYGWEGSVNGYKWIRIRCTALTSGTQTWVISPAPYATEPIPAAQASATQPVSGTVTATIAAAATTIAKAEDAAHASGDVGVPALLIRNDAATVNTSATGDYVNPRADSFGQQAMIPGAATSVTASSVNDQATSIQLLAANTARKGVTIRNDSDAVLYIKLGATATTNEAIKLYQDDEYVMDAPIYTGVIDGIWSANSTGAARILEVA